MRKAAHFSAGLLSETGKGFFITAVVVDEGWGKRFKLSDAQWQAMFDGFKEIDEICAGYGIKQVLHPHVNTLVETQDDVNRVLAGSDVRWLLDTGHLQIGGTD
ncbi:MAG: sugar phosphate isomerase/epimerase family protein, partial [bacterium]